MQRKSSSSGKGKFSGRGSSNKSAGRKSTSGNYKEKRKFSEKGSEKESFENSKSKPKFNKEGRPGSGSFKSKKKYSGEKTERGSYGDSDRKPKFNKEGRSTSGNFKEKRKYSGEKTERGSYGDSERKPKFSREGKSAYGSFKDKKKFSGKKADGDSFNEIKRKPQFNKEDKFSGKKKRKFNPNEDLEESSYPVEDFGKDKKNYQREKKSYQSLTSRKKKSSSSTQKADDGTVRLNKFLSNAGICSRREADQLIESGVIRVNGKVVTELGTKILPTDKVSYGDQTVRAETLVYLLLNKPKDYITTVDDPNKRKTVMELIKGAVKQRIYPVGRLDRNTTGLLLFTNDGELTLKLTHPKNDARKIYHVVTDKNVAKEDMEQLREGIQLEDGFIMPDDVQFVGEGHNKKDIGVEIHSGKNRVVRRMFEHLGYKVIKLDRVMFAGLTKKDLPRGKWRFLTPKEINFLKMS